MKKDIITKIISIIVNLFITISTTILVIIQVQLELKKVPDITRITFFNYFTTLSNIYSAIVSLVVAIFIIITFKKNSPFPKWLSLLHLSAVTSVALTFITCVFFLAPMEVVNHRSYWGMFTDFLIFVHFLNPVLALLDFVFLNKYHKMNWICAFWGIIPMVIYGAIYSTMVISKKWNDFYGFTFGGNVWLIFIVLPIMICVTYLISFLLVSSKKVGQK